MIAPVSRRADIGVRFTHAAVLLGILLVCVSPVLAEDEETPEKWESFIQLNADFFNK